MFDCVYVARLTLRRTILHVAGVFRQAFGVGWAVHTLSSMGYSPLLKCPCLLLLNYRAKPAAFYIMLSRRKPSVWPFSHLFFDCLSMKRHLKPSFTVSLYSPQRLLINAVPFPSGCLPILLSYKSINNRRPN